MLWRIDVVSSVLGEEMVVYVQIQGVEFVRESWWYVVWFPSYRLCLNEK